MKRKYLIYILIFSASYSCSYNSEDDLTDDIIVNVVTYEDNIKTIIDNNCIFCHSNPPTNGAPMSLTTYLDVKDAVENRNLIGRISATDASVMPAGGQRLPQSIIDLVIQWQAEGLIEN
ncbi:hypothetical protein [uncultured Winogradskyella sp.]|uniref:hypothetical protein n=1 Tax=uncultured Winogradskyella sp. TaxID=395353 RepID=UPI00262C4ADA|nr:hypothetical protein [uncultured Winogradskyella sp.]